MFLADIALIRGERRKQRAITITKGGNARDEDESNRPNYLTLSRDRVNIPPRLFIPKWSEAMPTLFKYDITIINAEMKPLRDVNNLDLRNLRLT